MTGDRKLVSKLKLISFTFLLTILSHASAFAQELQTWDDPLLPTLRVTLNEHASIFTAIIDTGAHASVINESVIDKLGIETSNESMEFFFPAAAQTVKLYRANLLRSISLILLIRLIFRQLFIQQTYRLIQNFLQSLKS